MTGADMQQLPERWPGNMFLHGWWGGSGFVPAIGPRPGPEGWCAVVAGAVVQWHAPFGGEGGPGNMLLRVLGG